MVEADYVDNYTFHGNAGDNIQIIGSSKLFSVTIVYPSGMTIQLHKDRLLKLVESGNYGIRVDCKTMSLPRNVATRGYYIAVREKGNYIPPTTRIPETIGIGQTCLREFGPADDYVNLYFGDSYRAGAGDPNFPAGEQFGYYDLYRVRLEPGTYQLNGSLVSVSFMGYAEDNRILSQGEPFFRGTSYNSRFHITQTGEYIIRVVGEGEGIAVPPTKPYLIRISKVGDEFANSRLIPLALGTPQSGQIDNTDEMFCTGYGDVYSVTVPAGKSGQLVVTSDVAVQARVERHLLNGNLTADVFVVGKNSPRILGTGEYRICVEGGTIPMTSALPYKIAVYLQ
jgi:hypothetical protein